MGGTPSERACSRVQNAIAVGDEFAIAALLLVRGVVPDVVIPFEILVLGRQAVEDRHLVIVVLVIATRFQEQYLLPCFRQITGERAAACTGAYDNVIVAGPMRYSLSCHLFYIPRFSATMASTVLTVEMIAAVVAARRGS